jgi:DNA replication factor GINS
MPDVRLNLKKIVKEEKKAKLSALDGDFYEKAHKLFEEIKIEIGMTDPDDIKYGLLVDELKIAKMDFGEILEIRMGKIVKEASVRKSLKQKEQHDPENLIPLEKGLYDILFSSLVKWRKEQLQIEPAAPVKAAPVKAAPVKAAPAKAAPETVIVKPPAAANIQMKDYIVVRMLRDIPTFVGADLRNYTLGKEDVATLPALNALAMISKKAAVQIQINLKK